MHKTESEFNSYQSGESPLSLQLSSPGVAAKTANIFLCKENVYLSAILVCDGNIDCRADDISDEDVSLCKQISDVHKLFGGNRTLFSSKNINTHPVNGTSTGVVASDTFVCKQSGKSVPRSLVNDLIPDCGLEAEDELLLILILMAENSNQPFTYKKEKPNHCFLYGKLSCREGHFRCFFPHEICVFKLSGLKHLLPCRNGAHLIECTQFECNAMFKCSSSYCIPWHYVCNNRWDCPHGEDEAALCPGNLHYVGKFSCVGSTVCVHLAKLCNDQTDCPNNDDEYLCSLSHTICPFSCSCVRSTVLCLVLSQPLPVCTNKYTFLTIQQSIIILNIPSFQHFADLLHLRVHASMLGEVCIDKYPSQLQYVDFKQNPFRIIKNNCFGDLKTLRTLLLHQNQIAEIQSKGLVKLTELQILNISNNPLGAVSEDLFHNWNKLKVFSILTPAESYMIGKFLPEVKVAYLEVSDHHLCCFKQKETKCSLHPEWYDSCSDLLPTETLKMLFIVLSVLVFAVNVMSSIFQILSRKCNPKEYNISVYFLTVNGIVLVLYLVIIWGKDLHNLVVFLPNDPLQKTKWCNFAFLSFTWYSLQTFPFLAILSYLRYSVVAYPMKDKGIFKIKLSVQKLYTSVCLCCLFTSGIMFSVVFSFDTALPANLCIPHLNPTATKLYFSAFTILNAVENITVSFLVTHLHIQLVKTLKISQEKFKDKKITKRHKGKDVSHVYLCVQLFLTTLTCFLSWYPLHLSSIVVLFMERFSTQLMHYLPVVSVPIQSLVAPTLLGISAVKNLWT